MAALGHRDRLFAGHRHRRFTRADRRPFLVGVLVGFAVGGLASGLVLAFVQVPKISAPRWLAGALALWLLAVPFGMPRPPTHDWVTKVALVLSGRPAPYTRNDLHRDAARRCRRVRC